MELGAAMVADEAGKVSLEPEGTAVDTQKSCAYHYIFIISQLCVVIIVRLVTGIQTSRSHWKN